MAMNDREREQHRIRMKRYRDKPNGKAVVDRANIKAKKLSPEEYDALWQAQNGVCVACGQPETMRNRYGSIRLAIDHNHDTGEVRGLLCGRCNTALGYLQDATDRIEGLLQYRQSYP